MFKEMFQETDKRLQAAQATIADLQGQVTELEGKNGFTQGTFSELYALRQRVAQLEKEKASTVAAAIELVDSKSCDTHKQEIKAEGFDVFYDKEKKAGCQRCLQADHTRVLRLVQAFRKINGTVTKLDVETQVILDAQPFIDLLTYRASLPAQPAQGDALAEAANIAFDHQCEDPQWCNCNSAIYKELDRLREGR